MKTVDISDIIGKTITKIEVQSHTYGPYGNTNSEAVRFYCQCGRRYQLQHPEDCCESVHIADVCGNWKDLLNTPILQAEESSNDEINQDDDEEYFSWTFYRLTTIKGQVVIRWEGKGSRYYSQAVKCQLRFDIHPSDAKFVEETIE